MKGKTVTTLCLRSLAAHGLAACIVAAGCSIPALRAQAQSVLHSQAALAMPHSITMPQGAFLRKPSADVMALVQQVKSDPTVAIRYSRLFHLPVKMVPLAFEQLHLTTLKSDHIMQVHFVRALALQKENSGTPQTKSQSKEDLVYKPRRVKAGTTVYCLPDGTPLLIRVCGNPIRTRVAPEFYTNIPVPDFNAGEVLLPVPASSSINLTAQPRLAALPITPLPVIPVVAAENVLSITALPIAPAMTPAVLRAASLPPVYQWAHTYNGLIGGLAGAPLLGLIPAFASGRSSTFALPSATGIPSGTGSGSASQPVAVTPPAGTPTTSITLPTPSPGVPTVPSLPSVPTGPSLPSLPTPPTLPALPSGPGPLGGGSLGPLAPPPVPEPGAVMLGLVFFLSAGFLTFRRRVHR